MKYSISILILACLASVAFPQDAGGAYAVRIRTLGWDISVADLLYDDKGTAKPMSIPDGVRSTFYDYRGPGIIVFFRMGRDPEGNEIRVPVTSADIRQAGPWPLLIFTPNTAGKSPEFLVRAIADDLASFPAGTYRFVNATTIPMAVKLGGDSFRLDPLDVRLCRSRPDPNRTTIYARVAAIRDGALSPVYGNNWAFEASQRTLVFIRPFPESPAGATARRIIESAIFPKLPPLETASTQ